MAKEIKKDTTKKKSNKKSEEKDKLATIKIKNIIPSEVIWIFKIFIMIFIALSIFSHSYLDSSFNRVSSEAVKNYFGVTGSYFSDIIFQLLGVVSYIIPIFFPVYYIKKAFFTDKNIFYSFIFQMVLIITIISSLITIYPIYSYQGGIVGSLLTLGLTTILNDIGASLLLASILLSVSILMYEIPVKKLSIAFFTSITKMITGFFSLMKNHLLELKESSKNIEKELSEKKPKPKKSKKSKDEDSSRLNDLTEEYDNIKMEKLKIKEEAKLEKEKIKLEKIREKQERKKEKKEKKERAKVTDAEALIINEIFEEEELSKGESVTHPTMDEKKPTESKKPTPSDNTSTSSEGDNTSTGSVQAEANASVSPVRKGFVMYSISSKGESVTRPQESMTPPAPKAKKKEEKPPKIKFANFEAAMEEEGQAIPTPPNTGSAPLQGGEFTSTTPEDIEIKVAKQTNTNSFENFEILTDKTKETNYKLPSIDFLKYAPPQHQNVDESYLVENAKLIVECLNDFNIGDVKVKEIFQGPTLTTYEIEIKRGIQISKVIKYTDEIAAMLKVSGVRMVSIPQKGVIGVEVPNKKREIVWLKEIIASQEFQQQAKKSKLTVVLGKDISGEPIIADLAKMPHLLIAGTTGSGKSVFNNVLITSILYNATPDEVKFILIDPKMLEFSLYNEIPNLLFPVIIDPQKAAHALNWAVDEMERRYKLISEHSERDIISYNNKAKETIKNGPSKEIQDKIDELENLKEEIAKDNSITEKEREKETMEVRFKIAGIRNKFAKPEILPYIVVVLDEYADLMMVAGKNVEISISRIAQKARAAGIHLVIATQRPDKDVVTGIIKANLPVRVALSVKGSTNSKIILDVTGAEKLLGHGDLLYLGPGTSTVNRIQSPLVTSDEQKKVLDFLRKQGKPTYSLDLLNQYDEGDDGFTEIKDEDKDAKYDEAVKIAIEMKKISASYLQRRLKLGYNRAARIVEVMEKEGIVGPPNGSKPRVVMVDSYNIS